MDSELSRLDESWLPLRGTHPSTRLCQAALVAVLATRHAARVLDVGTRHGILCEAALRAGATLEVVGIDRDARRIDTARKRVPGALFRCTDAYQYLTQIASGAFDVVVANLPEPTMKALLPELVCAARLGGTLIVGGLLYRDLDAVGHALRQEGATLRPPQMQAGWSCILADC